MESTFWEILAHAFLWAGVAATGLAMLALVVAMIVVARKKDASPFGDDEEDGIRIAGGPDEEGGLDEKLSGAQLQMMAENLRRRSERRKRLARNIRAAVLMILALWILGPLIYAFFAFVM